MVGKGVFTDWVGTASVPADVAAAMARSVPVAMQIDTDGHTSTLTTGWQPSFRKLGAMMACFAEPVAASEE
jgi:hypothetical protein